jgi:hypothetical protein
MTEEKARHYAKALAQGMWITFCAIRSSAGRFLPVQKPSDDCKILAISSSGNPGFVSNLFGEDWFGETIYPEFWWVGKRMLRI